MEIEEFHTEKTQHSTGETIPTDSILLLGHNETFLTHLG